MKTISDRQFLKGWIWYKYIWIFLFEFDHMTHNTLRQTFLYKLPITFDFQVNDSCNGNVEVDIAEWKVQSQTD